MTQLFPRNIQIDAAIEEAKESEGDSEVREGMMAKAQLLARTATKDAAVKAYAAARVLVLAAQSPQLLNHQSNARSKIPI